jgi:hypothetical protein
VRLLIARDIGPVREVLRQAGADHALTLAHPTVAAAVEAALTRQPGAIRT